MLSWERAESASLTDAPNCAASTIFNRARFSNAAPGLLLTLLLFGFAYRHIAFDATVGAGGVSLVA